jgi:hypothetical protein
MGIGAVLLTFIALLFGGGTPWQKITQASAVVGFTLQPDREKELFSTLQRFSDEEDFEFKGNMTIHHGTWENWLNIGLYSKRDINFSISGEPPAGHYRIVIYSENNSNWKPVWDRLISKLKNQFGDQILIDGVRVN